MWIKKNRTREKRIIFIAILSLISKISISQEINLFVKDIKEERPLEKEGGLAETVGTFKKFFEGFSNFGSGESLSFYIDDKKYEIVEIFIYNGEGKK